MRTQRRFVLKCFAAVMLAGSLHAQAPVGSWNFTGGDLNAEVGLPLEYQMGSSGTAFGTTSGFGIPDINGVPAPVMRVSSGNHGGYRMRVPLGPNGGAGAGFVNDYTVIMDVLYPEASNDLRRPLLETDQGEFDIASGAEFYVSASNQLGGLNNLWGTIAPNVWHRVGIVWGSTRCA